MNKFEQVSSDGHQMSLAEGSQVSWPGLGVPGFMSGGAEPGGSLYNEVQYIMGNGNMGSPFGQTDTQL